MSHELRTPLNGIIGFAQLLELEARATSSARASRLILKSGRHLLDLINEILICPGSRRESWALPGAGPGQRGRGRRPRHVAARGGLQRIDVVVTALEGYVLADRQRFQQVVLNLLSNAIKYNRAGGAVRVSSEVARAGSSQRRDTGRASRPR